MRMRLIDLCTSTELPYASRRQTVALSGSNRNPLLSGSTRLV